MQRDRYIQELSIRIRDGHNSYKIHLFAVICINGTAYMHTLYGYMYVISKASMTPYHAELVGSTSNSIQHHFFPRVILLCLYREKIIKNNPGKKYSLHPASLELASLLLSGHLLVKFD